MGSVARSVREHLVASVDQAVEEYPATTRSGKSPLLEQENDVLRRAALYLTRDIPTMIFSRSREVPPPLVLDLYSDGAPSP